MSYCSERKKRVSILQQPPTMPTLEKNSHVSDNSKRYASVWKINSFLDFEFETIAINRDIYSTWCIYFQLTLARENNLKEYKSVYNIDSMPTTGAGSEFGREAKEEARRRKYGYIRKKYNPEAQPWLMQVGAEKNGKRCVPIQDCHIVHNSDTEVIIWDEKRRDRERGGEKERKRERRKEREKERKRERGGRMREGGGGERGGRERGRGEREGADGDAAFLCSYMHP